MQFDFEKRQKFVTRFGFWQYTNFQTNVSLDVIRKHISKQASETKNIGSNEMIDLYFALFLLMFCGGLTYFWQKCQMFAVSKFALLMGVLMWPFGAVVIGIYWVLKDFFLFRKSNKNEELDFEIEKMIYEANNNSTKSDKLYLDALEEYESDKKDKALHARLFAENDGKEELVKAKYITHRVEQMIQPK